ncbi:MAG TPA: L-arabinose isomerase [Trueperaceae bacterium]|nr:L-arabinose isomerase [Trueperaceae bacterium]
MSDPIRPDIWFLCGSQELYGADTLRQVDEHARAVAAGLAEVASMPLGIVFKGVLTNGAEIAAACREASHDPGCAGVIVWMHTFSPAKMWIRGLAALDKPLCHLHTQFNRDLPWDAIDMDFMNLNQSAHGDREAGHLHTRMGLRRKVVVGHWSDPGVHARLAAWAAAAHAWWDLQGARIARFGDSMRQVAVTDGDRVAAEMRFGFTVDNYGVAELVERVDAAGEAEVDALVEAYREAYRVAPELAAGGGREGSLRDAARIELGLRAFLAEGGFKGFSTNFQELHGLKQLPGVAVQRLMAEGYGFGAEGDWKTAALLRAAKVMTGASAGTSFMEDYTYHLPAGHEQVLGAHMLEVCPTIAAGTPSLEVHPLSIGGKDDPVRLVFDARPGAAVNVSLVDLGNRFRLLVNEVEAVTPPPLPKLPVARALWRVKPDFQTGVAAWIHAGGAHHTVFSYALTSEQVADFAEIAGVELVVIDDATELRALLRELRLADLTYTLDPGIRG